MIVRCVMIRSAGTLTYTHKIHTHKKKTYTHKLVLSLRQAWPHPTRCVARMKAVINPPPPNKTLAC